MQDVCHTDASIVIIIIINIAIIIFTFKNLWTTAIQIDTCNIILIIIIIIEPSTVRGADWGGPSPIFPKIRGVPFILRGSGYLVTGYM